MTEKPSPRADLPAALAIVFASLLPSLMVWTYFYGGPDGIVPGPFRQAFYGLGKLTQFVFPLLFVWFWECGRPRLLRPRVDGVAIGFAFGLAVAFGIFGLYFGWLRDSTLLAGMPALLRKLLQGLGMADGPRYFALAAFYVTAHSLFEEYYYRWFIFGRLRAFLPLWFAVALSSLVFMAHHLLLLAVYLPGQFWTLAAPLSLCVAVGGGVWAWLYAQTRSLYAPWLSHALVDAALFAVGWDMLLHGA